MMFYWSFTILAGCAVVAGSLALALAIFCAMTNRIGRAWVNLGTFLVNVGLFYFCWRILDSDMMTRAMSH